MGNRLWVIGKNTKHSDNTESNIAQRKSKWHRAESIENNQKALGDRQEGVGKQVIE
jgi:hypothetical protein